MAFQKGNAPRYAKGFSEAAVYDIVTGDLLYWTNKLKTGNTSTSMNDGAIEAGVGNKLVMNIPDTIRLTGTFESADFSLEARGLQMGSTVHYNAKSMVREKITATSTTLTVTQTPVAAYGLAADNAANDIFPCYVGNDGVNYGVNAAGEVQGFTATAGQTYCVQYYTDILNAESLAIPANFSPTIGYMVVKTPIYSENGSSAKSSSLAGYLYGYYPRVQFIGGDAGINGSQTEASTTGLNFTALAYDDLTDDVCADCASEDSVYGYLTYVPCGGDTLSAVQALAIVGGVISVAVGGTPVQMPVYYYLVNGELVTPKYTDLQFSAEGQGAATAQTPSANTNASVTYEGLISGVAAGNTTITVSVPQKPTLTTQITVNVTGG